MVNVKQLPKIVNVTGKQFVHYAEMLKKTKPTQKHLINPQTIALFDKLGTWLVKQSMFLGKTLGIKVQESLKEFQMPDLANAASSRELIQRINDLKTLGKVIRSAKSQTKDENVIRELSAIEEKLQQTIPLLQRTINESVYAKIKNYWDNASDNPMIVCENISKKFKLPLNETLEIVESFNNDNNDNDAINQEEINNSIIVGSETIDSILQKIFEETNYMFHLKLDLQPIDGSIDKIHQNLKNCSVNRLKEIRNKINTYSFESQFDVKPFLITFITKQIKNNLEGINLDPRQEKINRIAKDNFNFDGDVYCNNDYTNDLLFKENIITNKISISNALLQAYFLGQES